MAKRYGIVIDLERCIGCHTCTVACKLENDIEPGSWIEVGTVGGDGMDTAGGSFPNLSMSYLPKACMHCGDAPCIDACPPAAIRRRDDGIVVIDSGECDGCRICLDACPYEVLHFDEAGNVAAKCSLCSHRVDEGLEPYCVLCCEGQALHFGDLADPASAVSRLAAGGSYVLLPEAGTDPATRYLPSMAPRGLP